MYRLERVKLVQKVCFGDTFLVGGHMLTLSGNDALSEVAIMREYTRAIDSFRIDGWYTFVGADWTKEIDSAVRSPGTTFVHCTQKTLINRIVYWDVRTETWECKYDSLRKKIIFSKTDRLSFFAFGEALLALLTAILVTYVVYRFGRWTDDCEIWMVLVPVLAVAPVVAWSMYADTLNMKLSIWNALVLFLCLPLLLGFFCIRNILKQRKTRKQNSLN